jgi:uncharacterized protein YidB (DUF937 family)
LQWITFWAQQEFLAGCMGFLDNLENEAVGKVLGGVVSSWMGSGENCPITADPIPAVLGSDPLKALSAKAGISPDQAGNAMAQLLPALVNRLTPMGRFPIPAMFPKGRLLCSRTWKRRLPEYSRAR